MIPPGLFPGLGQPAMDQQPQSGSAEVMTESNSEGGKEEKDKPTDGESLDDVTNTGTSMYSTIIFCDNLYLNVHLCVFTANCCCWQGLWQNSCISLSTEKRYMRASGLWSCREIVKKIYEDCHWGPQSCSARLNNKDIK